MSSTDTSGAGEADEREEEEEEEEEEADGWGNLLSIRACLAARPSSHSSERTFVPAMGIRHLGHVDRTIAWRH